MTKGIGVLEEEEAVVDEGRALKLLNAIFAGEGVEAASCFRV